MWFDALYPEVFDNTRIYALIDHQQWRRSLYLQHFNIARELCQNLSTFYRITIATYCAAFATIRRHTLPILTSTAWTRQICLYCARLGSNCVDELHFVAVLNALFPCAPTVELLNAHLHEAFIDDLMDLNRKSRVDLQADKRLFFYFFRVVSVLTSMSHILTALPPGPARSKSCFQRTSVPTVGTSVSTEGLSSTTK